MVQWAKNLAFHGSGLGACHQCGQKKKKVQICDGGGLEGWPMQLCA